MKVKINILTFHIINYCYSKLCNNYLTISTKERSVLKDNSIAVRVGVGTLTK
jgi:hypothetical protein